MDVSGRGRSMAFFIVLGACLVALAITLNVGWIVVNWRYGVLMFLGAVFFAIIISGMVLNTIFLVREIRRNDQHTTFINNVTHELKTPIASIRLYLETLQKRPLDEEKRQEFYRIMLSDSDRLLGTVEQVLHAGRAGRRQLHRARVQMDSLAQDCVELARTRHHLTADSIRFQHALQPGDTAEVLGDLDELKAVISNLLDNAIKYSGADVRVEVSVERMDPKTIAIHVQDHGVGIAPTELKRIFKRFYRVPGAVAMRVKGTGLGLFIVRSVAERHGGKAFAASEGTGTGSRFTVQLPSTLPAVLAEDVKPQRPVVA